MNNKIRKNISQLGNIIKGKTPNMLVYFVTGRCNAQCKMCFYSKTASKNELTLPEIEKISLSLGPLYWLLLSGGEPFLHEKLPEICSIFIKNNDVRYLQIPTNGWDAVKISNMVENILKNNSELPSLVISVSIDHIGSEHDKIRGFPGLYDKAIDTVKTLLKMKSLYPNLGVGINITYSAYNYKDIDQIYDTLANSLPVDHINITLTRGKPRDKSATDFTLDNYVKICRNIEKSKDTYRHYPFLKKVLGRGKDFYRREIIFNSFANKKYTLPCKAGKNVAVLSESGNVYICELRDDNMGNIRDYDYDFNKLWNSKHAAEVRRDVLKSKCHCTYECVMGPNILFNAKFMIKSFFRGLFSGK